MTAKITRYERFADVAGTRIFGYPRTPSRERPSAISVLWHRLVSPRCMCVECVGTVFPTAAVVGPRRRLELQPTDEKSSQSPVHERSLVVE